MVNNRLSVPVLAVVLAVSLWGCGAPGSKSADSSRSGGAGSTSRASSESSTQEGSKGVGGSRGMSDKEITDLVVDCFMSLTKVPRPSHHEEKISAFMMDWAKSLGFKAVSDQVGNVIVEVPASPGMEDKPLGILQGHMDMVVAVVDGKTFDPLEEGITAIRNDSEGTITADGTSLGADDGIGDAIMMGVAQGAMQHGPLRLIFTVDEEDGMTGAFNLDKAWLEGASFLINIDNEAADQVLVSTAAGDIIKSEKKVSFSAPKGDMAVNVTISGLKGGHSGIEIDKGRLNGIVGLADFLKELEKEGVGYELASFSGGSASNAIPSKATALLVIASKDRESLEKKAAGYCNNLNEKFKGIEEGIKLDVSTEGSLPQVTSKEERNSFIRYITEIINGVYTMSKDIDGLVESSSNLGIAKLDREGVSFVSYARSSSPEKQKEITEAQIRLATDCGCEYKKEKASDAWPYDPKSRLLDLTKKIYREQNGEDIAVTTLHAGLECGTFKELKPDLDMISIGPDLKDVHSVKETLYINSIPKVWRLLEGLLAEYK